MEKLQAQDLSDPLKIIDSDGVERELGMEKRVFRFWKFEDKNTSIKTRSGYPVRIEVKETPGCLFGYCVEAPRLDLYIYGSSFGEVYSKIPELVLSKYRLYAGNQKTLNRRLHRFCRAYEERFEEV